MANQIIFYTEFSRFAAAGFVSELNQFTEGESVTMHLDSMGGSVNAGLAMAGNMQQSNVNIDLMVDGNAFSMAAFFTLFANSVRALNVSTFLFHRAAFGTVEQENTLLSQAERDDLKEKNAFLRSALESRVNPELFQAITGVSIDQMFSLDSRIDVRLTAQQAKDLGLVNEIITLTPQLAASFGPNWQSKGLLAEKEKLSQEDNLKTNLKTIDMDLKEFKSKHSTLFAEVLQMGVESGVAKELDRVQAAYVYQDVDSKKVGEIIASGKSISQAEQVELTRKQLSAEIVKGMEAQAPAPVATEKIVMPDGKNKELTAEQKEAAEIDALVAESVKGVAKRNPGMNFKTEV